MESSYLSCHTYVIFLGRSLGSDREAYFRDHVLYFLSVSFPEAACLQKDS